MKRRWTLTAAQFGPYKVGRVTDARGYIVADARGRIVHQTPILLDAIRYAREVLIRPPPSP